MLTDRHRKMKHRSLDTKTASADVSAKNANRKYEARKVRQGLGEPGERCRERRGRETTGKNTEQPRRQLSLPSHRPISLATATTTKAIARTASTIALYICCLFLVSLTVIVDSCPSGKTCLCKQTDVVSFPFLLSQSASLSYTPFFKRRKCTDSLQSNMP